MFKTDLIFSDLSTRNIDYIRDRLDSLLDLLFDIQAYHIKKDKILDINKLDNNYVDLFIAYILSLGGSIKLEDSTQYGYYLDFIKKFNKVPYESDILSDYCLNNPMKLSQVIYDIFNLSLDSGVKPKDVTINILELSCIISYYNAYFNKNGLIFLYNIEILLNIIEDNIDKADYEFVPLILGDKLEINGLPMVVTKDAGFVLFNSHKDDLVHINIGANFVNFSGVLAATDIDVLINVYNDKDELITTFNEHINKIDANKEFYYGFDTDVDLNMGLPVAFDLTAEVGEVIYEYQLLDDSGILAVDENEDIKEEEEYFLHTKYIHNNISIPVTTTISWLYLDDKGKVTSGGCEKDVTLPPDKVTRIFMYHDKYLDIKKTLVSFDLQPIYDKGNKPDISYIEDVAGVKYNNRQDVISKLKVGEELNLVIEPNNQYDDHAVRVETMFGDQIGYISHYTNYDLFENLKSNRVEYHVSVDDIYDKGYDNLVGVRILIVGFKK